MWLDAVDQFLASPAFSAKCRQFMEEHCHTFIDVRTGEHGLEQNDVHKVGQATRVALCEVSAGLQPSSSVK